MYIYAHNTTHTTMCMQNGDTPLHIASQGGHDRVVDMLLQAGATVDLQDKVENGYYLFFCYLCCAMHIIHCTLSTTNIQGKMKVRKHIQQITAADMHWRIKALEACTFNAWSEYMFSQ